ncbi:hypothetical protein SJI19_03410 [Acerihabitans sp. TG2]|nr:hypothetical protein [Acerihabitans sp. TG2]MEA9389610.1 hypothetical protein [Acerihabitans sp. TG2]
MRRFMAFIGIIVLSAALSGCLFPPPRGGGGGGGGPGGGGHHQSHGW